MYEPPAIVLFVSVSVPAKVANVPEVGNVTPVLPVVVSVVVCAPLVVKAPPSVTLSPPILETVNAPALKRVPELFCKNERLIIPFELAASRETVLIVPVAAVLVASIQIHGLDKAFDLEYGDPTPITLNGSYKKGNEMGYFHHGSTILLFTPDTFCFDSTLKQGALIKYGQPLIRTA